MILGFSPGVEEGDLDTTRLAEEGVRCWRRDGVEEGVPVIMKSRFIIIIIVIWSYLEREREIERGKLSYVFLV